jgi:hypothetical protein
MCRNIRLNVPKKKESPEEIAKQILKFLNGLKSIDEAEFSEWYELGWSKKEAQSNKVPFEEEYLLGKINKRWDKQFPELGTHFSFWNGKDDDDANSLVSFILGVTSKNPNLSANVRIEIPSEENIPTLNEEKVKRIVALMQDIWGKYSYDIF